MRGFFKMFFGVFGNVYRYHIYECSVNIGIELFGNWIQRYIAHWGCRRGLLTVILKSIEITGQTSTAIFMASVSVLPLVANQLRSGNTTEYPVSSLKKHAGYIDIIWESPLCNGTTYQVRFDFQCIIGRNMRFVNTHNCNTRANVQRYITSLRWQAPTWLYNTSDSIKRLQRKNNKIQHWQNTNMEVS